jgi:hypothetical protein
MEATTIGAAAPLAAAPPQHMLALRRANEIRLGHAHLKRDILAGRVTVIAAFTDPRAVGSISVSDVLKAQRRWGATRARKFLQGLQISETKRVDALTSRQRQLLIASLPRA